MGAGLREPVLGLSECMRLKVAECGGLWLRLLALLLSRLRTSLKNFAVPEGCRTAVGASCGAKWV